MTNFLSAVKLQNSPFIIRHFSFIFPKCFLLFSLGMFFSANCHHLSFHRVMQNKIKKWRQKTSVFLIAKAILESKTPLRLLPRKCLNWFWMKIAHSVLIDEMGVKTPSKSLQESKYSQLEKLISKFSSDFLFSQL